MTRLTPKDNHYVGFVSGVGASHAVLRRDPPLNTGRLAPFRYKVSAIWLTPRDDGMNLRAKRQRQKELRRQAERSLAEGKVLTALQTLNEIIEMGQVAAADWLLASHALLTVREFAQAVQVAENGLQSQPDHFELQYNLASALFQLGDVSAAVKLFENAAQRTGSIIAWQSLATIIPGCPLSSQQRVLEVRRAYAAKIAAAAKSDQAQPLAIAPSKVNARIRVGYISAFFHRSNYMKPVWGLINGHDREQFEMHLFVDDTDASGLQWFAEGPHDCVHFTSSLDNQFLGDLIRKQELDIVVDLNGYSVPQRLPLLTQRLAPNCCAWFNMYATSGMPGIDWIVGDEFVVRAEDEVFYSECVKRLPGSYLSFEVGHQAPDIVLPPCVSNGGFTFGSLVSQYKITPAVLDAWSEILRRTPTSKLLIANRAMNSECNRDYMIAQFDKRGVASGRVMLKPPAEHFEYLQYYDQIDLALDAFPWNGGTTTTEAIWQGVPVLTFDGDRWASRTSRTLLMNSHLTEFVANDERTFVEAAVRWGNDVESPQQLQTLRQSMRDRLQTTLCQMDRVVHSMEALYREIVKQE